MKLVKIAVVAVSFVGTLACAQTPSESGGGPASQTPAMQNMQSEKHESRREFKGAEDPNACVGPVSFCRPYFGS